MAVYESVRTGESVAQVAALIGLASFLIVYVFRFFWFPIVVAVCQSDLEVDETRHRLDRLARGTGWPMIFEFRNGFRDALEVGDRRLLTLRIMNSIAWLSAALASFVVAWPLRETLIPGNRLTFADFIYGEDFSYYGIATSDPASELITRSCGIANVVSCPGSRSKSQGNNGKSDDGIPAHIRQIFRGNGSKTTLATPFEIRYRIIKSASIPEVDQELGQKRSMVGDFQPLVSHALDDSYSLVEGLILDTISGGLGLRNHTIPKNPGNGAQWEEDILWITPVSACTNTNLTFHYTQKDGSSISDGYMQDSGGISLLDRSVPEPRWDYGGASHSPPIPKLQSRSYNLAWWNNNLTAAYLNQNVGTGKPGKKYKKALQKYFQTLFFPSEISILPVDGSYLGSSGSNPSPLTAGKFTFYGDACSGFNEASEAAVRFKPYIRCGYLFGVPTPEDGRSWENNYGSKWSQNLYTCASSVKASYKTVTFQINDTATLAGVKVLNVREKEYNDDFDVPLWGVERAPGYVIQDINRVWGRIEEKFRDSPLLDTRRAPELFLPAAAVGSNEPYSISDSFNRYLTDSRDTFAAGYAFTAAWNSVYNEVAAVGDVGVGGFPNYNGRTNYAQLLKWRSLGANASGAAQILNLIWTDLASFSVISTRTGFENTKEKQLFRGNVLGKRQVQPLTYLLVYGNSGFMVPGVVVLTLVLIFGILSLVVFFLPWGEGRKSILTFDKFKKLAHTSRHAAITNPAAPPSAIGTTGIRTSTNTNNPPINQP